MVYVGIHDILPNKHNNYIYNHKEPQDYDQGRQALLPAAVGLSKELSELQKANPN